MIQDFDGLVGRFPRRREYIWMQPVCALAVPDTSVGARLVAHGSDIHERDLTYAMQRKRQLKRA